MSKVSKKYNLVMKCKSCDTKKSVKCFDLKSQETFCNDCSEIGIQFGFQYELRPVEFTTNFYKDKLRFWASKKTKKIMDEYFTDEEDYIVAYYMEVKCDIPCCFSLLWFINVNSNDCVIYTPCINTSSAMAYSLSEIGIEDCEIETWTLKDIQKITPKEDWKAVSKIILN